MIILGYALLLLLIVAIVRPEIAWSIIKFCAFTALALAAFGVWAFILAAVS